MGPHLVRGRSSRRECVSRDCNVALLNFGSLPAGLLVAPRMVRGRPSQFKGAFGVAARSLRDP